MLKPPITTPRNYKHRPKPKGKMLILPSKWFPNVECTFRNSKPRFYCYTTGLQSQLLKLTRSCGPVLMTIGAFASQTTVKLRKHVAHPTHTIPCREIAFNHHDEVDDDSGTASDEGLIQKCASRGGDSGPLEGHRCYRSCLH